MTTVRIEDLSVALGGRPILKGVSLEFAPGGVIGLIGPNGAGKSTLLKAMLGFVPSTGRITYDDVTLADLAPRALARLVSYLPQDREIAWPMAVESVVALGRTPHLPAWGGLGPDDRAEVDRAMALTDTEHLRGRIVSTLSGGERARVLMARVLAQAAPVLIADEPTAGLDPGHQIALLETLHALAEAGRTVILTLHEIALAARWCTRIVLLDGGRVVADGLPRDVLTEAHCAGVYGVRVHRIETEAGLLVQPMERLAPGERGDAADETPGRRR